jgi:hypothetical protein
MNQTRTPLLRIDNHGGAHYAHSVTALCGAEIIGGHVVSWLDPCEACRHQRELLRQARRRADRPGW